MGPLLTGFADELVKLGATLYETQREHPYEYAKAIAKTQKLVQPKAAKGKLPGQDPAPFAQRSLTPNPLTSPNQLTEYKA